MSHFISRNSVIVLMLCCLYFVGVPVYAIDLTLAVSFTESTQLNRRALGWNSLSHVFHGVQRQDLLGNQERLRLLETRALEQLTPEAMRFLETCFHSLPEVGRTYFQEGVRAIFENSPITTRMIQAILVDKSHQNIPLEMYLSGLIPAQGIETLRNLILSSDNTIARKLAFIIASRSSYLRNLAQGSAPSIEERVYEGVQTCSNTESQTPMDTLVRNGCRKTLFEMNRSRNHRLANIVSSSIPRGVIPINSSIDWLNQSAVSALGICPHRDPLSISSTRTNLRAAHTALVPFSQVFSQAGPFINQFESWLCLPGSNVYAGYCSNTFRSLIRPSDAVQMEIVQGGLEYRAWYRQPGEHQLNTTLVVGHQVSESTHWIAARVRNQSPVSTFRSTGNSYLGSGDAIQLLPQPSMGSVTSTLQESGSGWMIFPVIPGRVVSFALDINHTPQPQGGISGFMVTPSQKDVIEVLEFSPQNVASVSENIDIFDIGARSSTQQGLVHYIASIQRELAIGRSLIPQSADASQDAQVAISRLRVPYLISRQDPALSQDLLQISDVRYPQSSWRERQQFLKMAFPAIGYRIFKHYGPRLEAQVVNLGRQNLRVRNAYTLLTHGNVALENLSRDQLEHMLNRILAGNVDVNLNAQQASQLASTEELQVAIASTIESLETLISDSERRVSSFECGYEQQKYLTKK